MYDNGRGPYNQAMMQNMNNMAPMNINMNAMNNINNPQTTLMQSGQPIRQMFQPRNGHINHNNNNSNNNGHNNNHNHNRNGHNSNNNSNNNDNNNSNNNNKGPTKDTWISPFKSAEQNMNFFMFMYKCQPCHMRRNCPSKVTCPNWHHEGEKRRNPGEEPNFLYSEEPCPNVKPQGSNKWLPPSRCTDGDHCGYSHTLLEQMYHPNIYKTSICINYTNPSGNKCQWGYYCTHAHGQEDIRNPNKKSSPNSNNSQSTSNQSDSINQSNTHNSLKQQRPKPRSISELPPYRTNKDNGGMNGNHMMISSNMYQQQHPHPYVSPQPKRKADFSPLPVRSHEIHNAMQHNVVPPFDLPTSHHQPPQMFYQNPYYNPMHPQQHPSKVRTKRSQSVDTMHSQFYSSHSQSQLIGQQQHHGAWAAPVAPPMYEEINQLNNQADPMNPYTKKNSKVTIAVNGFGSHSASSLNGNVNRMPGSGGTPPPITASRIPMLNEAPVFANSRQVRSRSFGNLWEDSNIIPSKPLREAQSYPSSKDRYNFLAPQNMGNTRKKRTQSEPPLPTNIWAATGTGHQLRLQSKDDMLPNGDPSLPTVFSVESNDGLVTPSNIPTNLTDWFPFLPNEMVSPVIPNLKNDLNKQGPNSSFPGPLPSTPPAPPDMNSNKMNAEILRLREQLQLALTQIDKLSNSPNNDSSDLPTFGTSTKRSFNMNKFEMEENKTQAIDESEELKRQQLLRYSHFITCPGCDSKGNERNRVLIPCGHLICNECCNENSDKKEKCPICDDVVCDYQILKIG